MLDSFLSSIFRPRKLRKVFAVVLIGVLVYLAIQYFSGSGLINSITQELTGSTSQTATSDGSHEQTTSVESSSFKYSSLPAYSGSPYLIINGNEPYFTASEIKMATAQGSFESYGDLDSLGRCTECIANVGYDLMPTEDRESISEVKPTGWKSQAGENPAVYNRCHLIGFQLTGENANKQNLITGTRALNVDGMLPFENMIADYVKETRNHVLYRVTPYFVGSELVARGVIMEAYSIEDDEIRYCVWCYNNQIDIEINYKTGDYSHVEN